MTSISDEIKRIADKYLRIEILETRSSDRLDFHDLAVWEIKAALTAAYMAGAFRQSEIFKEVNCG